MVFLDGAIARLAPDLDLFAEIAHIATYFTVNYGERIATEAGLDPTAQRPIDLTGVKASFGVDPATESLTYRDLQERRALIRQRLARRQKAG
jgi:ubiquinone biosynthesis protein